MYSNSKFSSQFQYFHEILYLYFQIAVLLKSSRKMFSNMMDQTYDRLFPGTMRSKKPKINIFGQSSLRRSLEEFSHKILLDNNMTHLLKKIQKMFRSQVLHFHIALVLPDLKLINVIFQKISNMVYLLLLSKIESLIKKMRVYKKNVYRSHQSEKIFWITEVMFWKIFKMIYLLLLSKLESVIESASIQKKRVYSSDPIKVENFLELLK